MDFKVIGISHRTAAVEVRESFALNGELARRFLCAAHDDKAFREAMILDTCNRTEVYFVPGSGQVYVYSQTVGSWTLNRTLAPSDALTGEWFGRWLGGKGPAAGRAAAAPRPVRVWPSPGPVAVGRLLP